MLHGTFVLAVKDSDVKKMAMAFIESWSIFFIATFFVALYFTHVTVNHTLTIIGAVLIVAAYLGIIVFCIRRLVARLPLAALMLMIPIAPLLILLFVVALLPILQKLSS